MGAPRAAHAGRPDPAACVRERARRPCAARCGVRKRAARARARPPPASRALLGRAVARARARPPHVATPCINDGNSLLRCATHLCCERGKRTRRRAGNAHDGAHTRVSCARAACVAPSRRAVRRPLRSAGVAGGFEAELGSCAGGHFSCCCHACGLHCAHQGLRNTNRIKQTPSVSGPLHFPMPTHRQVCIDRLLNRSLSLPRLRNSSGIFRTTHCERRTDEMPDADMKRAQPTVRHAKDRETCRRRGVDEAIRRQPPGGTKHAEALLQQPALVLTLALPALRRTATSKQTHIQHIGRYVDLLTDKQR